MGDDSARIMILRLGAVMCPQRDSLSLPTIIALPASRANSSPGWRASGAGRHPEEGRLRYSRAPFPHHCGVFMLPSSTVLEQGI